ncbi:MAG: lipoyl(octanoyl) transferase LipB [Bacteroidales bacterium]
MRKTKIMNLGLASYRQVWELQESLHRDLICNRDAQNDWSNNLILVEHPHVFTIGKNGDESNFLEDRLKMLDPSVETIRVNRGGDVTYHGPGQLVVYPILDMNSFSMGVKSYVDRLEEVVISLLKEYNIDAQRMDGATGVWIDAGKPRARKICAIGVKCSKFATMHGLALNVNSDLSYFEFINPCGFIDKGVTSIERELNHHVDFKELTNRFISQFIRVFGIQDSDITE